MTGSVRFDGVNLVARDPDATIEFYRRLGLPIDEELVWRTDTGPHHVGSIPTGSDADLDIDSAALAERYNAGYAAGPERNDTILGFRLESRDAVDALHAELVAAGYASRQEPYDAFWGARYAIVADPDGRAVGLMSPRDPERNQPPPDV